jgi:hypothetical protein
LLIPTIYSATGSSREAWSLIGCVLYNLWTAAKDKRTTFQFDNYNKSGGIEEHIDRALKDVGNRLGNSVEGFLDFLALEGIRYIEGQTIVSRPVSSTRIPPQFTSTIEYLVKQCLFIAGISGSAGESIIEIVPAVIERYGRNARIGERVNEMEELREATRAADQWKLKGGDPDWLIHRGSRLLRVKNLASKKVGLIDDQELNAYLAECEKASDSPK